ncbi:hypothetical protein D3C72_2222150 [compost metagenome]
MVPVEAWRGLKVEPLPRSRALTTEAPKRPTRAMQGTKPAPGRPAAKAAPAKPSSTKAAPTKASASKATPAKGPKKPAGPAKPTKAGGPKQGQPRGRR